MSVLSWIKGVILPEAAPPTIAPLDAAPHPLSDASDRRDAGPDQEVIELQRRVFEESEKNRRATLHSLKVTHVAISAEERSRDMLDELMRSMNRGKNQ